MISAFGVDHGEISKGLDKFLTGDPVFGTIKDSYKTGRYLRGLKTTKKGPKYMEKLNVSGAQIKNASKKYGLAGRVGYHQEKIAGGAAATAAGGAGYAAGKKKDA